MSTIEHIVCYSALLLLVGCASDGPNGLDRDATSDLDPTPDLLVASAARLFERDIVLIESTCVDRGYHPLDELIYWGNCEANPPIQYIIDSLLSNESQQLTFLPKASDKLLDPIRLSRTKSIWEILDEQKHAVDSQFDLHGPTVSDDNFAIPDYSQFDGEPYWLEEETIETELELSPDQEAALSVKAIRYGVFVHADESATDRDREFRCRFENTGGCYPKDLMKMAALEEQYAMERQIASLDYDADEILRLTLLAPELYMDSTDMQALIEVRFLEFYSTIVESQVARAREFFVSELDVRVEYTKEEYLNLEGARIHGPEYNASASFGVVYISPLLVRAPFFMCFESGVKDYLHLRNMVQLTGTGSWSDDDLASNFMQYGIADDTYRACVSEQSQFLINHELVHALRDEKLPVVQEELFADCIAFQLSTDASQDFDLFREVVLPNEEEAVRGLREKQIIELASSGDRSGSFAEAESYCYQSLENRLDEISNASGGT